ncbi:hypothetical protein CKAN_00997200 [Cinnamomum micranthum f. kanehirae]|uniref:Integrase catalytic domain-containing protein n=1 Tax=Cinnamomum micranthum f. kanehirae TaxID=337451 RepID=A0A443NS32_9MAGN|nr:hypothetical protein CKAN_00997200 [Cinnamomum micranthum f. kanehirae]
MYGASTLWGHSLILVGSLYSLLTVDYVSKWVEAKATPINDFHAVIKFVREHIFARFGTPRAIISDGGTHFCNKSFEALLRKYGVTHRVPSPYHPQTNGQRCGLTAPRRTAYKTPIGTSPFRLVYGKPCHLPVELEHTAYWAIKKFNFDMKAAGDHRRLQLNELEELRNDAYESARIYKSKTKAYHDKMILRKTFEIEQKVLLFNSRLKLFPESREKREKFRAQVTPQVVEPSEPTQLTQGLRRLRRFGRVRHEPQRDGFLVTQSGDVLVYQDDEPKTYNNAISDPDSTKWLEAMKSEMDSMKSEMDSMYQTKCGLWWMHLKG